MGTVMRLDNAPTVKLQMGHKTSSCAMGREKSLFDQTFGAPRMAADQMHSSHETGGLCLKDPGASVRGLTILKDDNNDGVNRRRWHEESP
jgi:hypothetical protein